MLLAGDLEGRGGHHCSGVWCEWGIGVGESLTYACAGVTQVCLMTSQSQDQGCGEDWGALEPAAMHLPHHVFFIHILDHVHSTPHCTYILRCCLQRHCGCFLGPAPKPHCFLKAGSPRPPAPRRPHGLAHGLAAAARPARWRWSEKKGTAEVARSAKFF